MQGSTIFNITEDIVKNNNRYVKRIVNDPSIKDDGIYDIDEDCLLSISNRSSNVNIIALFLLIKLSISK